MVVKRTLVIFRVSNVASTTANQAFAMEQHIASLGYVPTIRSFTASSWKKPIAEMTQLYQEVMDGAWSEVVLWRVDRTGRNHKFDVDLWNLCVQNGVLLRYIDEDFRSDRPEDEVKFYKQSVLAMEERLLISKRTKLGLARKREQCKRMGLPWTVGGKRKGDRWGKTLAAIPTVLDLLRIGYKIRRIANQLKLTWRLVKDISVTPIAELRRQTGQKKLQPWQGKARGRRPDGI